MFVEYLNTAECASCLPCQRIDPLIQGAADAPDAKFRIGKEEEDNRALVSIFRVDSKCKVTAPRH